MGLRGGFCSESIRQAFLSASLGASVNCCSLSLFMDTGGLTGRFGSRMMLPRGRNFLSHRGEGCRETTVRVPRTKFASIRSWLSGRTQEPNVHWAGCSNSEAECHGLLELIGQFLYLCQPFQFPSQNKSGQLRIYEDPSARG